MKTVAFFDTKSYDKESFLKFADENINIRFFENKLNADTVSMAACCDAVCAFVNDNIDKNVILNYVTLLQKLYSLCCR